MFRIALGLVVFAAVPAMADELRPASPIQSVIVYPSGAAVSRSLALRLPTGGSVIVIDDLPAEVETDSIKVDGSGDGAFSIGSVATKFLPADPDGDPARKAALDAIRSLEDRAGGIDDRIAALDSRRKFIEKMIDTTPNGFSRMLAENAGGIEKWSAASAALGADLDAVAAARRGLEIEKRAIEADKAAAQKQLGELPPPRDRVELRIEVSAEAAASANLSVGYRLPSARWEPVYDAQLSTGEAGGKPSLAIVRRAEITQATGEDWRGVALTLSTSRPAGGTAAPYLDAALASLEHPYEPEAAGSTSYDTLADAPMPAARAIGGEADLARKDEARPADVVEAAADFGDFHAEYRVPATVSLESGVGARAFRIATETPTVELQVRAVPILTPSAYLTARFLAPAGAPLLAGKVALYRDGAFVGQGAIAFANAGSKIDLGFGTDDRVKVTRVALDRATAEHGVFSSRKTDTRRFKITVENLHRQPLSITVLDRAPYAEDETVRVVRLEGATAPTTENVDDRRGVMAWTYTYDAGQTRDIEHGYEVSWPADKVVYLTD
ncbi:MAG: mucoidy inhibitor MuiA family protein [Bauldia sp.]